MELGKAFSLIAIIGSAFSGAAAAQTVVDGDTIKLNGTTYRLWGIDAPESAQDALVDGGRV